MAYNDIRPFYSHCFETVIQDEHHTVLRVLPEFGAGQIIIFPILPGMLFYNAHYWLKPVTGLQVGINYNDMYLVHYVLSGSAYTRSEDGLVARIHAGDCLCYSGDFHFAEGGTSADSINCLSFYLDRTAVHQSLREHYQLSDEEMAGYRDTFMTEKKMLLIAADHAVIERNARLLEYIENCDILKIKAATLDLLMLYGELFNQYKGKNDRFYPKDIVQKIEAIAQHMAAYPDQKDTLDDLAEQFNINKTYIKTIFKDIYGLPPMRYWRSLRMAEAKSLLEAGTPVLDTALAVGYDNPSKFAQVFRKHYGCLPSKV